MPEFDRQYSFQQETTHKKYHRMKINSSFSVVVGNRACNANCPYCISKMTRNAAQKIPEINERRFEIACRIAEKASDGLVSVLLTGNGEPLLFPEMITRYLHLMKHRFPLVDLQTNGILLKQARDHIENWRDSGLTLVCISIAHHDPVRSNQLMGIKDNYNFYDAIDALHEIGLAVRLNCTMLNSGINGEDDIGRLISNCRAYGVEQLTLREVEMPNKSASQDVRNYVVSEKPRLAARKTRLFLESQGATPLTELSHGAIVYDYHGQNVCISNCLTKSLNPNDTRQIIFYPDGRITYDWQYPGARIL